MNSILDSRFSRAVVKHDTVSTDELHYSLYSTGGGGGGGGGGLLASAAVATASSSCCFTEAIDDFVLDFITFVTDVRNVWTTSGS